MRPTLYTVRGGTLKLQIHIKLIFNIHYAYWDRIISYWFSRIKFSTDSVSISRDIANYGYDEDFWFKR